ncbi:PadR family transcriptional regulator [Fulvivirga sp. M361]|uniref:PadR family transcriptional regulator n=1 Tax=Fulvivirga sp. M361 TaxID=2594266 RepID=UPI00117BDD77|nr:PadR family transcriptional regulator [Fulvivirga sp. M361]TRX50010.1 PadR family transcriptional regulator [Fulvivirga sp. M361]
MKGTNLGEFEELVLLAVAAMQHEAYSLAITKEINRITERNITFGVVHSALNRLETKGFVESEMGGATKERGGRRKRIFNISTEGKKALVIVRQQRETLWSMIPKFVFEKS